MITWKKANRVILASLGYSNYVILGDYSTLCLDCFSINRSEIIADQSDLIEEIGQEQFDELDYCDYFQWIIYCVGTHLEKTCEEDSLYCSHCQGEIIPVYE